MPESDFTAAILETEVVVNHVEDGHVFHFPILSNGTVSLHGSRIEPNPAAKREARRYLFDAHNAARAAFGRSKKPVGELIDRLSIAAIDHRRLDHEPQSHTRSFEPLYSRRHFSFDLVGHGDSWRCSALRLSWRGPSSEGSPVTAPHARF